MSVAQMVDTLDHGGLERMARDLANRLPRDRVRPSLIATRRGGPLHAGLADDVQLLVLDRTRRIAPGAFLALRRFLSQEGIQIVHAHGLSIVPAAVAVLGSPRRVVWHVHSGEWATRGAHEIPAMVRWAARRAAFTITVTEALARWCVDTLGLDSNRVAYLPNFLADETHPAGDVALPGHRGSRIVCVANLRPEKDHATLLDAMAQVATRHADAHLVLVGDGPNRIEIEDRIRARGLGERISLLGHRGDVPAILRAADVAILASRSEGFPVTLLEYGRAGLPTVATRVGQCAEILDHGDAGWLVDRGESAALAGALANALERALAPDARAVGDRLRARVTETYAVTPIVERIVERYAEVLGDPQQEVSA